MIYKTLDIIIKLIIAITLIFVASQIVKIKQYGLGVNVWNEVETKTEITGTVYTGKAADRFKTKWETPRQK